MQHITHVQHQYTTHTVHVCTCTCADEAAVRLTKARSDSLDSTILSMSSMICVLLCSADWNSALTGSMCSPLSMSTCWLTSFLLWSTSFSTAPDTSRKNGNLGGGKSSSVLLSVETVIRSIFSSESFGIGKMRRMSRNSARSASVLLSGLNSTSRFIPSLILETM